MLARLRWLMACCVSFVGDGIATASKSWNRFWFTPTDPTTLCLIRVLAGLMLFYTHAVWTIDLEAFFGEQSWLSREVLAQANQDGYSWSVLSWCRTPASLWAMHIVALATFVLLTIGLWTRIVSVLAFVFTASYAQRAPGALYGLDQINGLLSLYLMVGPSGSRFSVDAWRARRASQPVGSDSVTANLAVRLMQCHLCVIYLFAGLSKLQGVTWWNGSAVWGGIANQEYQTLDVTWLGEWPLVINAMTHLTVAWEVSYCVLIWNRWTRPLVLFGAIAIHLGIVVVLGMPTFGLAMLIANVAFICPSFVRTLIDGPPNCNAGGSPAMPQRTHAASAPSTPHFSKTLKRAVR